MISNVWRLWGGVAGWLCVASLLLLSRGVSLSSPKTRARARFGVLYSGTLSTRDVGVPRPAGSLTARVIGNGGSALPRVSTSLITQQVPTQLQAYWA